MGRAEKNGRELRLYYPFNFRLARSQNPRLPVRHARKPDQAGRPNTPEHPYSALAGLWRGVPGHPGRFPPLLLQDASGG
jgi:hypothetical protein